MVSETANNVIGAMGGVVLVVCLLPQLLRMYVTKSARDLSYAFLGLYVVGLTLTALYLIFIGDAIVGWVAVICEIALGLFMLVGKIYLDHWGPNPLSQVAGLTIPARTRLEIGKILSGGTVSAPFPLLRAEPSHAAAHLLLDCRIKLSADDSTAATKSAANGLVVDVDVEVSSLSAAADALESGAGAAAPQPEKLHEFATMLEECMEGADLDVFRRQTHEFASFRQRSAAGEGQPTTTAANLCFIPSKDGYASAMWMPESATLAVDLVGAAPETIAGMGTAAEKFCIKLNKTYPGSKIVASAVSRLEKKAV